MFFNVNLRNSLVGINPMLKTKVLQMPVSRFNETETYCDKELFLKAFAAKKQSMLITVKHGFSASL